MGKCEDPFVTCEDGFVCPHHTIEILLSALKASLTIIDYDDHRQEYKLIQEAISMAKPYDKAKSGGKLISARVKHLVQKGHKVQIVAEVLEKRIKTENPK